MRTVLGPSKPGLLLQAELDVRLRDNGPKFDLRQSRLPYTNAEIRHDENTGQCNRCQTRRQTTNLLQQIEQLKAQSGRGGSLT